MSANSVLPPFLGDLRADRIEYFAGIARNDEVRMPQPIAEIEHAPAVVARERLAVLSRFETSIMTLLAAAGPRGGLVILPPTASSISPKFRLNAICCSSVMGWSWNTSTA